MTRHLFAASLAALLCLLPVSMTRAQDAATEEQDPVAALPWEHGPTIGKIGERATIEVPEGYSFLGAEGARQLDVLFENPPTGTDQYVVAAEDLSWVAYFSFSDIGYIKDVEVLDADNMLVSIREGTEEGNVERRSRGWETLNILGWSFKPQYDKQLNALEWAILGQTEPSQSKVINYNTRLLGRRGVMEVVLVTDPEVMDASIAQFKAMVPGYSFADGEKYSEFKPGDHVAEIGLAALITGGAAAVASKKGFFAAIAVALAKFWKLVLLGIVGIGVAFKKLFQGKDKGTGQDRDNRPE
jgi:uncharacterized membrane-anchored protein